MILNAFSSLSNNCYQSTSFRGKNNKSVVPKSNPLKRVMPWIFGGLMTFGGACTNGTSQTYSGSENYDGIRVEYTDVSKQTKDSVMLPVYQLKDRLKPENDFLRGMKINLANDFREMKETDSFERYVKYNESGDSYRGTSFYSDSLLPKRIGVQEKAFKNSSSKYKAMRQTLMHEVGHHFDNFFGHDHKSDIAQKWDSIMHYHEKSPASDLFTFKNESIKDVVIERSFYENNSLSDKEEFVKALYKDINNLKNKKELPKDIYYYLKDISVNDGVSLEDLKYEEGVRTEIYANLFSYLSGQDDGGREKFLDCFSDSKKVVAKDMRKFLKLVK